MRNMVYFFSIMTLTCPNQAKPFFEKVFFSWRKLTLLILLNHPKYLRYHYLLSLSFLISLHYLPPNSCIIPLNFRLNYPINHSISLLFSFHYHFHHLSFNFHHLHNLHHLPNFHHRPNLHHLSFHFHHLLNFHHLSFNLGRFITTNYFNYHLIGLISCYLHLKAIGLHFLHHTIINHHFMRNFIHFHCCLKLNCFTRLIHVHQHLSISLSM